MSHRSALALLLVTGLACAAPPLPEQAPPTVSPLTLAAGESLGIEQVLVITDASGTMYARKTFPIAKALTRGFVAGMPAGSYRAGLVAFGGQDRTTVPVGPFDRETLASTAGSLQILGDLDGYGGTTPFHRVFGEAQDELGGAGGRLAVVVFSDGLADRVPWSLDAGRALAESVPQGVCFHTVQTGNDPAGAEFLTALAAMTDCGSARLSADVGNPNSFMGFVRDVFDPRGSGAAAPGGQPDRIPGGPGADRCSDMVRLRGVEFDFDKSDIRPDAAPVLDVAVDLLGSCPNLRVTVDGHTDWTGPEVYNQGLSERRAESVRRYLVGAGIADSRLRARGFGEGQPIASNDSREGRARNRRVELNPVR